MQAQDLVKQCLDKGDFCEAARLGAEVLKAEPESPWALMLMGRVYQRAGYRDQAKPFFSLAGKLGSSDREITRRVEAFERCGRVIPSSRADVEDHCNPDLVLIQAPGWGINTPPLATAMLSSYVRSYGFKVLPVDLNIEFFLKRSSSFHDVWEMEQSLWFWQTQDSVRVFLDEYKIMVDEFIEMVLATGTQVVGFTIYDSSQQISLELARMLKQRKPDLWIIVGGPHVSRFLAGPAIAANPAIDAVCQGEGEETLVDILGRRQSGGSLSDCPGILVRSEGNVVDNGDRPLIEDLDTIPPPDFSDYSFERYRTPGRLPVLTSRGCPNRCIFCNERPFWKKFRFRSADGVYREIVSQRKRYPFVNFIDFQDSLVNGVIRELKKLADLLIEGNLKMEWAGQAVIRKEMTTSLLKKLRASGCVCMAYGMETASSSLMLKVGKVCSRGANPHSIAEAHAEAGLGAVFNFMFGLPGESEEDSFEALEFLRRIKGRNVAVNPSPLFCGFGPGTLAYEHPERYGVDLQKGPKYWESTDRENTYVRRLKRFEDFCRLVKELEISTTYPSTRLLDRDRSLGEYYQIAGDPDRSSYYFGEWLKEHPDDQSVVAQLREINAKRSEETGPALTEEVRPMDRAFAV